MRTLIYAIAFGIVFTFATLLNHGGTLGLGNSSYTTYGWPRHWLRVRIRDTRNSVWINGKAQPGEVTTKFERVDIPSLTVSASASAAIAGVFSLPFLFFMRHKAQQKDDDGQTA